MKNYNRWLLGKLGEINDLFEGLTCHTDEAAQEYDHGGHTNKDEALQVLENIMKAATAELAEYTKKMKR